MQTILLLALVISFIYFLRREIKHNATENSFIFIVNHTFRTPLTRIKWMSDALAQEVSPQEQEKLSRDISVSVNKVLQVVDTLAGIKDVNNRSGYDLKAVSIREVIEQAIAKYRAPLNEKKITFQVPTLSDIPLLTIDTKKISFVVDAILENAIWYCKENGHITISSVVTNKQVTLYITDDGIGLSGKDKRNIFDRFYRGEKAMKLNTDGMGLSLYLSKEIMSRHKGSIKATSKGEDLGSTFSITLPISRK